MSVLTMTPLSQNPRVRLLLQSPRLPLELRLIQDYLDEEKRKRQEFYDWITEDSRAEFINGEIKVKSPAKDIHTVLCMNLSQLLSIYVQLNDCGEVRTETALVVLTRNDYLPDICFFGLEKAQMIEPNQMKYPPPDFIVEILSPSTERKDRREKMDDYSAHGVAEYWLVDPISQTIEQYTLQGESYTLLTKLTATNGNIRSDVIEGFDIPVAAVFDTTIKNETLFNMPTRTAPKS